jgi:tetratricopeptide repeat protein 21B
LFGKARYYFNRCNFSHSLDVVNQVVASYEGFLPALVEKMKVQLALQDWDQALETAHR